MHNHDDDDILFARRRRPSIAPRRANRRGPRPGNMCRPPVWREMSYDPQPLAPPLPDEITLVDVAGRPKQWHCMGCGWRCNEPGNDYLCRQCGALRPFVGGGATMILCKTCNQWSLVLARFCEWCGNKIWSS